MKTHIKSYASFYGIIALGLILLFWVFGNSISPVDYLNKIDQSKGTYVQSKVFGDLNIQMVYHPPAYQAAAQYVKSGERSEQSPNDLIETFSQTSNYRLRFENIQGGGLLPEMAKSTDNYQDLVQYFSFAIQEDLFLCTPTDTLKSTFVHFERNYNLAPFINIEVGFDTKKLNRALYNNEEWAVLFNAERFALGPLYFRYKTKEVSERPQLKF